MEEHHPVNISVNGQPQVPPGFRFHPTEDELLRYYLRKKVASEKIDLDVIPEIDLNKLEPWDIQEKCRIGTGPQNDWYLFSHKDKKYPTGTRTNRATVAGFWKATGRDKAIHSNSKRIGMRKTLVFYQGRAPNGLKSDWIMHEYRLELDADDHSSQHFTSVGGYIGAEETRNTEDGWVICRVFKKKNYLKAMETSQNSNNYNSADPIINNNHGNMLDGFLKYMEKSIKNEEDAGKTSVNYDNNNNNNIIFPISTDLNTNPQTQFNHLPNLINTTSFQEHNYNVLHHYSTTPVIEGIQGGRCSNGIVSESGYCDYDDDNDNDIDIDNDDDRKGDMNDWGSFDRLLASQLDGQMELYCPNTNGEDEDFWSYGRSLSSDPLCHLSTYT